MVQTAEAFMGNIDKRMRTLFLTGLASSMGSSPDTGKPGTRRTIRIILALALGFAAFSMLIIGIGRFEYSRSPRGLLVYLKGEEGYESESLILSGPSPMNSSFRVVLEFDKPSGVRINGNCSLVEAEKAFIRSPLLSPNKYREVLLANISGVYRASEGKLDIHVDLKGCLEADEPYKPRIILYPLGRGFPVSLDIVSVRVKATNTPPKPS